MVTIGAMMPTATACLRIMRQASTCVIGLVSQQGSIVPWVGPEQQVSSCGPQHARQAHGLLNGQAASPRVTCYMCDNPVYYVPDIWYG
jgi:hypothetical protein